MITEAVHKSTKRVLETDPAEEVKEEEVKRIKVKEEPLMYDPASM
jgi:hypothetical protein